MNRREFLKVASAGFGTLLVSGLGFSLLTKPNDSTPAAAAAPISNVPATSGKQNIVVITGSPHRNGTSALLADKFIEGAQSKGHNVFRFNVSAVAVLGVLVNHFRRLLSVSLDSFTSPEILAEMLGVKPFAVKQYKSQSKNFSQKQLKKYVDYLEDTYEDVLNGKYSETSALKNVVINLI